jgi:lipopolysaccharide/colanic/teichoic acid biosynthesis glycosyltransferase
MSTSASTLARPAAAAPSAVQTLPLPPAHEPAPAELIAPKAFPQADERVALSLRAIEVVISATVLILSSPILIAMAFLIRRGTPGPALFVHQRVGINRKLFSFVKFRTLYADARRRFPDLYAYKYTPTELTELKFKVEDDPRVTPQGRWMRKSTFDELPNFWNVLKGNMALVGPRPEIPEMLPYYKGDMLLKFTVRPGITGIAQISGRGRLGFHETVAMDVEYVRNRSLMLDLKILVSTVWKIVIRDGAF